MSELVEQGLCRSQTPTSSMDAEFIEFVNYVYDFYLTISIKMSN